MSDALDIRNSLRKIIQTTDRPYSVIGNIEAVDGNTCDVKLLDSDVVIFDVLLSVDGLSSINIVPAIGSKVIINFLSYDTAYVALTSQVEKTTFIAKDTNGNDIESLKEILIDFITETTDNIQAMTHTTSQGPTVSPPVNGAQFTATKDSMIERINKIFD